VVSETKIVESSEITPY